MIQDDKYWHQYNVAMKERYKEYRNEWHLAGVSIGNWDNKFTSYTYTYTNLNHETLKYLTYTDSDGIRHDTVVVSGKNGRVYEQYVYTIDQDGNLHYTISRSDRRSTWEMIRDGIVHTIGAGVFGHESSKWEENPKGIQFLPYILILVDGEGRKPVTRSTQLVKVAAAETRGTVSSLKLNLQRFGEFGAKTKIKDAQLPVTGKIRYIPPEGWNPTQPLPRTKTGGYIDRFGNVWQKGPSRTQGQPFEWDVQLSKTGQKQLGWASRDGSHLNVSLDGEITHK